MIITPPFIHKLKGERVASLESTTFGFMISVLPRISNTNQEIEMIINLEDGAEKKVMMKIEKKGLKNYLLLIAQNISTVAVSF